MAFTVLRGGPRAVIVSGMWEWLILVAHLFVMIVKTATPGSADFQAASAVFSEKELVNLTIAIGLMYAYNRLAIRLWVPPKAEPSARLD